MPRRLLPFAFCHHVQRGSKLRKSCLFQRSLPLCGPHHSFSQRSNFTWSHRGDFVLHHAAVECLAGCQGNIILIAQILCLPCCDTVVTYQNESFSSKWELPCLPPFSLELWRKDRARRQLSFWWKTLVLIGHYSIFKTITKASFNKDQSA